MVLLWSLGAVYAVVRAGRQSGSASDLAEPYSVPLSKQNGCRPIADGVRRQLPSAADARLPHEWRSLVAVCSKQKDCWRSLKKQNFVPSSSPGRIVVAHAALIECASLYRSFSRLGGL